jgi:hypothetical protein
MDSRFVDIFCQLEGIVHPRKERMLALRRLIRSQEIDEKLETTTDKVIQNLFEDIYETEYEE